MPGKWNCQWNPKLGCFLSLARPKSWQCKQTHSLWCNNKWIFLTWNHCQKRGSGGRLCQTNYKINFQTPLWKLQLGRSTFRSICWQMWPGSTAESCLGKLKHCPVWPSIPNYASKAFSFLKLLPAFESHCNQSVMQPKSCCLLGWIRKEEWQWSQRLQSHQSDLLAAAIACTWIT